MAVSSQRCVAVLLAFLALLTGVMGESIDTDLVGIVVAAVCIAILFIVLCSFLAYCCFRGMDLDGNWVVGRKDSGSVSMPSSRPAYKVATDPIMYALPPTFGRADVYLERHSKLRHSDRPAETPAIMTSQSNGHVVHDLPSSEINFRAIHTQDVGTTPLWLTKSYMETEKSLEIQEDDDDDDNQPTSPPPSPSKQPRPSPQPPQPQSKPHVRLQTQPQGRRGGRAVRAEVSPKHSQLDSREVLHVSEEFTIIDFVDPLQLTRQQHQQSQQQPRQSQKHQQQKQQNLGPPSYSYRAYLDHDFHHTTAITRYCVPKKHIADISHGSSGIGYVPPVSTSTPRSPSDEDPARQEADHPRMRKPQEGSVMVLPAKSVGYKGDFQL